MYTFSGKRLRGRRKAARKSVEQVAVDSGRSLYSVVGYEAGKSTPSAEVLGRLADSLGCEPSDFYEVTPNTKAA